MGFNLLPWREKQKHRAKIKFIILFISSLFLIASILGMLDIYLKKTLLKAHVNHAQLSEQYSELLTLNDQKATKKYQKKEKLINNIEKNKRIIENIINTLHVITSSVPKSTYLTFFEFKDHKVNLKGNSTHLNEIDKLTQNLEAYRGFSEIKIHEIILNEHLNFSIEINHV